MFKNLKRFLPIALLGLFIAAIALLMILDYFDMESLYLFNTRGFFFDYTWKGRLFLLFFLWLFVLEFMNTKKPTADEKTLPISNFKVIAALVCAAIPLIYVISVNFFDGSNIIIAIGDALRGDYWREVSEWPSGLLEIDWILIMEYSVFTFSFIGTILLIYGKEGLKNYLITIGLIAGITAAYFLDAFFPYGVFKPFQLMTLPTAGLAAGLLELLNYPCSLSYSAGLSSMPRITIYTRELGVRHSLGSAFIAWPCAGVHSLFLYTLIILLLFKRSEISSFRKLVYFIFGAIGTYAFNILRIATYFVLLFHEGRPAASTFHDVYGDLYSVVWILCYMLLIISIEKFGLVEKTRTVFHSLLCSLKLVKKQAPENELGKNGVTL